MAAVDPADLVFLDETSTPTSLRSLRGKRPHLSCPTTLTRAGFGQSLVVQGAVDQQFFEAFVARVLVPSLRPGQTVVLDNLAVQKSATARRLIEAAGCRLVYLPTYAPDLNPLEQTFAKIKQTVRRIGARSWEVLAALSQALATVTAARAFYAAASFVSDDTT